MQIAAHPLCEQETQAVEGGLALLVVAEDRTADTQTTSARYRCVRWLSCERGCGSGLLRPPWG